jgi:hypothetical protein
MFGRNLSVSDKARVLTERSLFTKTGMRMSDGTGSGSIGWAACDQTASNLLRDCRLESL